MLNAKKGKKEKKGGEKPRKRSSDASKA